MAHQTKEQYVERVSAQRPIEWFRERLASYNIKAPAKADERKLAGILYDKAIVPLINMRMP